MGTQTALDAVSRAGSILEGIRSADDLAGAVDGNGGERAVRLLARAATDPGDQLTAIAAVHALARHDEESAGAALVSLLGSDEPFLREHAAWALGVRRPRADAISGLVRLVAAGGFPGMLAQRSLERWGASAPEPIALALDGALLGLGEPGARARLVETIGLIPGRIPGRLIRRVAVDPDEATEVRAAAIAALGDLGANDAGIRIVADLARGTDVLADVAGLALADLADPAEPSEPASPGDAGLGSTGRTIVQVFLPADIDRELSQVGSGDNGGIATLLVRLGDALVDGAGTGRAAAAHDMATVTRVLTLSRGNHAGALRGLADLASARPGHVFATVPFLGEPVASVDAWPRRVEVQRGLRRILRAAGSVDAIHLRMADVGTLAAATVARELEIPVVFTLAPDPHVAIHALEAAGELTRQNFGVLDEREHFWFRTRLAQRVSGEAARIILFPRPELHRDLRTLMGIDIDHDPERYAVVAEGIELRVIERAGAEALAARSSAAAGHPAFDALDVLLGGLPAERRGLPLAISVGRLHAVKGMATLVEAWLADAGLRARCNLLVVGGDLEHPSGEERRQLDRIDTALPRAQAAAGGLLLAGHRANDTVAHWLAATRYGRPGLAAAHGAYVCASVKEEFGIALLEAMATGLPVVAPAGGGPATFVDDGVTGFLVDTRDARSLARGIAGALDLSGGALGAANARRAHDRVARDFAIQTMADALSRVYRDAGETAGTARKESAS